MEPRSLLSRAEPLPPFPSRHEAAEALDLRQLRHQTSNTWQRMLYEVALLAGTAASPEARRIGQAIERRIAATAALADALFGFTAAPAPMRERLAAIGRHLLAAQGDERQQIRLEVEVEGEVPPVLQQPVLQVALEMIGNAVKHGLHARLVGRIEVVLTAAAEAVTLSVRDDGWGPPDRTTPGEGLLLMREIASAWGGQVALCRQDGVTEARLALPAPERAADRADPLQRRRFQTVS